MPTVTLGDPPRRENFLIVFVMYKHSGKVTLLGRLPFILFSGSKIFQINKLVRRLLLRVVCIFKLAVTYQKQTSGKI